MPCFLAAWLERMERVVQQVTVLGSYCRSALSLPACGLCLMCWVARGGRVDE